LDSLRRNDTACVKVIETSTDRRQQQRLKKIKGNETTKPLHQRVGGGGGGGGGGGVVRYRILRHVGECRYRLRDRLVYDSSYR